VERRERRGGAREALARVREPARGSGRSCAGGVVAHVVAAPRLAQADDDHREQGQQREEREGAAHGA
jgi:hypothetical protein